MFILFALHFLFVFCILLGEELKAMKSALDRLVIAVNRLNKEKEYEAFDRVSQSTSSRWNFKCKVIEYYDTARCMITGSDKTVAVHIVPANAKRVTTKRLQMDEQQRPFADEFNKESARNGLLLTQELETGFSEGLIVFIWSMEKKQFILKALDDSFKMYDNEPLKYGNKKAIPYRRALKFHFRWSTSNLTEQQIDKYKINGDDQNSSPWITLYELSELHSLHGDNDADEKGVTMIKIKI